MHIRDSIESDFVLNDANNGNIRHLFFCPFEILKFLLYYTLLLRYSGDLNVSIKHLLVIFERDTQQF